MHTTITAQPQATHVPKTGTNPRRELARYSTSQHDERIVYGQRVDGCVRLTDVGPDRSYLIESGIDTNASLQALLADYLQQAQEQGGCPMRHTLLGTYLQQLFS